MSENKNVPSSLHYPKARVILGFLLMGGGLGTWLFLLALKVHDALVGYGQSVAWQSIGDFVDFVYTVGHIFMGGLRIRFYTGRTVRLVAGGKPVLLHGLALFVAAAGV